uniref:Uncharacterized protein n=1 Tax=Anguilla anguilla TaxID=7936 RepID=A0A0E9VMM2_ANGAN
MLLNWVVLGWCCWFGVVLLGGSGVMMLVLGGVVLGCWCWGMGGVGMVVLGFCLDGDVGHGWWC